MVFIVKKELILRIIFVSDFIYLASSSHSRQELLKLSNIPFVLIKQTANEESISRNASLQQVVCAIAQEKMRCAILPDGQKEGDIAYVLSCDTMGAGGNGEIFGKPKDKIDAIRMLHAYRTGAQTGTAFCLEKRVWQKQADNLPACWELLEQSISYVNATYVFNVPDEMLELYFKHAVERFGISYLDVSGAVAIEDYGLQFVTNFEGSFTAVIGLPLYELRQELAKMGFKFS